MVDEWHHDQIHSVEDHTDYEYRHLFVPPTGTTNGSQIAAGNHDAIELADNETQWIKFEFRVPSDFVSFWGLKLWWGSPAESGQMVGRFEISYGAAGEYPNTHNETSNFITATNGSNKLNTFQDGTVFQSLTEDDLCGVKFTRYGANEQDTLNDVVRVLGLEFVYVAHQ